VGDAELSSRFEGEAKAEAEAELKGDIEISKDRFKVESKAKALAEADASIGVGGEIKTKDGHMKGQVRTGVEAIADAEASSTIDITKDSAEVRGRLGAMADVGAYVKVEGEAKTKAGSGLSFMAKGGEGVGAMAGGGFKVDKEGVHVDLELGAKLALGGKIKLAADFKYEDMKKPEFIAGSMIGGPIGGVAAVMARPVVEKAGAAIADGAKAVGDTAVKFGTTVGNAVVDGAKAVGDTAVKVGGAIADGASAAYDATTGAIGGAASAVGGAAKSLWNSIF